MYNELLQGIATNVTNSSGLTITIRPRASIKRGSQFILKSWIPCSKCLNSLTVLEPTKWIVNHYEVGKLESIDLRFRFDKTKLYENFHTDNVQRIFTDEMFTQPDEQTSLIISRCLAMSSALYFDIFHFLLRPMTICNLILVIKPSSVRQVYPQSNLNLKTTLWFKYNCLYCVIIVRYEFFEIIYPFFLLLNTVRKNR